MSGNRHSPSSPADRCGADRAVKGDWQDAPYTIGTILRASRNLWRAPLTHPVADKLPPPHSLHRYNTPVTTLKCPNAASATLATHGEGRFREKRREEKRRERVFPSAVEKPHSAIIKRLNLQCSPPAVGVRVRALCVY